jgi:hypothetical protein
MGKSTNESGARILAFVPRGTLPMPLAERHGDGATSRSAAPSVEVDLQAQIDRLHAVKTELELAYWDHPGEGERAVREREQIRFWVRQVAGRAGALESILMDKRAPRVRVHLHDVWRIEEIEEACRALAAGIPEGLPFEGVLARVAAILRAGDTLGLAAAGGVPVGRTMGT